MRRLDEIAGGIDVEQPRSLALDLAAQDERRVELDALLAQRLGVAVVHFAQRPADAARGFEHVRAVVQVRVALLARVALRQHVQHALRDGEVARGHQHEHAVAGTLEHGRLAERADLVDAGIRARIRQEHEARVQQHRYAIRHGSSVNGPTSRTVADGGPHEKHMTARWGQFDHDSGLGRGPVCLRRHARRWPGSADGRGG